MTLSKKGSALPQENSPSLTHSMYIWKDGVSYRATLADLPLLAETEGHAVRAETAADEAEALLDAAEIGNAYDTKADADAALGSIAADQAVMVLVDETKDDRRTIYRKEGGFLVFKAYALKEFDELTLKPQPLIEFSEFDDGTILNGQATRSGHEILVTSTGAATATVEDGAFIAPDNSYLHVDAGEAVKRVSGVYQYDATGSGRPVIMFNGEYGTLNKLVHLEINRDNIVMKISSTGAGNLSGFGLANTREINGLSNKFKFVSDMPSDEPLEVALEYRQGATDLDDTIQSHLPDGRIIEYTNDARIREVMATCESGTWQIVGGAGARWYKIETAGSINNAAPVKVAQAPIAAAAAALGQTHKTNQFGSFTPTASGWYTLVKDAVANTAFTAIVGHLHLIAENNAGQMRDVEVDLNSWRTSSNVFNFGATGFGGFGGNVITKMRLTSDGASSGNRQLDVYVDNVVNNNDRIDFKFDGVGTVVQSPVVGATALANGQEKTIGNRADAIAVETATTTQTFLQGVDAGTQILESHYSGTVTHYVDDTQGGGLGRFVFVRPAGLAGAARIENLSDNSLIGTLSAGQTMECAGVAGKYRAINRGTI